MGTLISSALLSCDFLLLAEEQIIKTSHPYFLQACNNLRKGIKAVMSNLFREILSLPLTTLEHDPLFKNFMNFMVERLLPNSRILTMAATIEAFLVSLAYKALEVEDIVEVTVKAMGIFWAGTDKQGSNLTDLATNASVIIQKNLKGEYRDKNESKSEEVAQEENTQNGSSLRGEALARDKIEEIVFDKKKRITEPAGLKFGYVSTGIVEVMVRALNETLQSINVESMNVNIEPIISLIKTVGDLTLEQVAFSENLTKMRNNLRLVSISLARSVMQTFAGSYHDLYPIIISDFKWKQENLEVVSAIVQFFIEFFNIFPRNFHQKIVFEEPNLLSLLPKLLVWTEKHQVDNSVSHLAKQRKPQQPGQRLASNTVPSDWLESCTKSCQPETVYEFRRLCMTCQ